MSTTDSNGIVFLEETDPISPFHTLMNTLQQGTSDAFSSLYTDSTQEKVTHSGTLAGTYTGQKVYRHYLNGTVDPDDTNGDFILLNGSVFTGGGVLGAHVHNLGVFDLVFGIRMLSGNLVARAYNTSGTIVVNPFAVTAEITYWTP